MRYYLYRQQNGQGCDYTIGCGSSLERLCATNKEDAIDEVLNLPDNWQESKNDDWFHDMIVESGVYDVSPNNDRTMSEITLLEVADETDLIPVFQAKLAEINQHRADLQNAAKEGAELAQYEKLKKKFGK